jgi:hypothetical protein
MLIHHDTTGTQTDCEKPLSRKKLKRLMPHSRMALTSRAMYHRTGRLNANIRKELAALEEARKAQEELAATESKATYKLSDLPGAEKDKKPSLFNRLGSMFGNLRKKAERESAKKGK